MPSSRTHHLVIAKYPFLFYIKGVTATVTTTLVISLFLVKKCKTKINILHVSLTDVCDPQYLIINRPILLLLNSNSLYGTKEITIM